MATHLGDCGDCHIMVRHAHQAARRTAARTQEAPSLLPPNWGLVVTLWVGCESLKNEKLAYCARRSSLEAAIVPYQNACLLSDPAPLRSLLSGAVVGIPPRHHQHP